MIPDSELWADMALAERVDWLRPGPDGTFTEHEAMCMIRSAYGKGYTDALGDEQPLTYLEAMDRATELRLRLPV